MVPASSRDVAAVRSIVSATGRALAPTSRMSFWRAASSSTARPLLISSAAASSDSCACVRVLPVATLSRPISAAMEAASISPTCLATRLRASSSSARPAAMERAVASRSLRACSTSWPAISSCPCTNPSVGRLATPMLLAMAFLVCAATFLALEMSSSALRLSGEAVTMARSTSTIWSAASAASAMPFSRLPAALTASTKSACAGFTSPYAALMAFFTSVLRSTCDTSFIASTSAGTKWFSALASSLVSSLVAAPRIFCARYSQRCTMATARVAAS